MHVARAGAISGCVAALSAGVALGGGCASSDPKVTRPVPTASARPADNRIPAVSVRMSLGLVATCALRGGHPHIWGFAADVMNDASPRPVRVEGLANIAGVACLNQHACAWSHDLRAWCWGNNAAGQLGVKSSTTTRTAAPTPIETIEGVAQMVVSMFSTCALRVDGSVWCWGQDFGFQQREIGRFDDARQVAISTDASNLCILRKDGTVWTWNLHVGGQPKPVPSLADATAIGGCEEGSTALLKDGTVAYWGTKLGVEPPVETDHARIVEGVGDVVSLSSSALHACAVTRSGQVFCWGSNEYGAIGDGGEEARRKPTLVNGIENATEVAVVSTHSCATVRTGDMQCWGQNTSGELGDGTKVSKKRPAKVAW